jgi:hypothetical protein
LKGKVGVLATVRKDDPELEAINERKVKYESGK